MGVWILWGGETGNSTAPLPHLEMENFGMTKRPSKPSRQKLEDRLISPSAASPNEVACDLALGGLDRMAREMDRKWGVDRLPDLVSPEMAAKYGSAMGKLNAAVRESDVAHTVARAEVCVRGLRAMDAAADAAGMPHSDPDIWEYQIDGHTFGIIADGRDWPAAYAKREGITIHTMREVALALKHYGQIVVDVKQAFNGAEVVAVRKTKEKIEYEEIPF